MACGLRCSSPLHLGAAGNYTSLKGLNPYSSSLPSSSSSSVPCSTLVSDFSHFVELSMNEEMIYV